MLVFFFKFMRVIFPTYRDHSECFSFNLILVRSTETQAANTSGWFCIEWFWACDEVILFCEGSDVRVVGGDNGVVVVHLQKTFQCFSLSVIPVRCTETQMKNSLGWSAWDTLACEEFSPPPPHPLFASLPFWCSTPKLI